jgi:Cation transporter/ATPase, N-terminus
MSQPGLVAERSLPEAGAGRSDVEAATVVLARAAAADPPALAEMLGTSLDGLSSPEAARRRERYGLNTTEGRKEVAWSERLAAGSTAPPPWCVIRIVERARR